MKCTFLLFTLLVIFNGLSFSQEIDPLFFGGEISDLKAPADARKPLSSFTKPVQHSPQLNEEVEIFKAFKRDLREQLQFRQTASANGVKWVPVQIHIAKNGNNMAMYPYTLLQYMNRVNENLKDANVQLYPCSRLNYINDANIYTLYRGNRSLLDPHEIPGVMNIFFVDQYVGYCGEGDYPGVGEKVIFSARCFGYDHISTLTHLIGQFLSLYSTHGPDNAIPELVDGSNCAIAGDEICDTPADPNFYTSGYSSTNCTYTGTARDANNQLYGPDETNFMSYATQSCRDHFTPGQLARLCNGATIDRANLTGCNTLFSCADPIDQFPYQESFENGWNGWEQMDMDYYEFTIHSGSTPTAGTGPSGASDGNMYLYSEATGNYGGTGIESPCFDLTGLAQPVLTYKYHMSGTGFIDSGVGVQVSLDGGFWWYANTTDPLISYITGDQGNTWKTDTVDLSEFANESSFRFRIIAFLGSNTSDVQDLAIDDIQVHDACFTAEVNTVMASCSDVKDGSASISILGTAANLSYTWSTGDTGVNTLQNLAPGNYSVTISDNVGCDLVKNFTIESPDRLVMELYAGGLASQSNTNGVIESVTYGGTPPYTYAWSDGPTTDFRMNLSVGAYSVTVTDSNGCTFSTDIYIGETTTCNGNKSNWPYVNYLEGGTGLFRQNTDDHRNWRKRAYFTPTSNTGPVSAAQGTYYRYFESSGNNGNPYKTAVLTTQKCLDLSNLTNPVFTFKYHMFGADMGRLSVQIFDVNRGVWRNSIWAKSGNQGGVWHQAEIDLSSYQNDLIRLRIVGLTGSGPYSDMAIDQLYIGEALPVVSSLSDEKTTDLNIGKESIEMAVSQFNVFPNPANDRIFLNFYETQQEVDRVVVRDGMGRIWQQSDQVTDGISCVYNKLHFRRPPQ